MYGDVSGVSSVDNSALIGVLSGMYLFIIVIIVVALIALWRIFVKAGREGWKALIPFYGQYVEFEIAGMNGWLFLLMFVPFVNYVVSFVLMYKLGKAFNKSTAFCLGLMFLSPIFLLILAFGSSEYALATNNNNNNLSDNINVNNQNNFINENVNQPNEINTPNSTTQNNDGQNNMIN